MWKDKIYLRRKQKLLEQSPNLRLSLLQTSRNVFHKTRHTGNPTPICFPKKTNSLDHRSIHFYFKIQKTHLGIKKYSLQMFGQNFLHNSGIWLRKAVKKKKKKALLSTEKHQHFMVCVSLWINLKMKKK